MKEIQIKFLTQIVKPWEHLNKILSAPLSLDLAINDFVTNANALAVTIKHLPESISNISPNVLSKESKSYEIISDLADSFKHGKLYKHSRECKLTVSSMFERNTEAKLRFLRNKISISHNKYGKIDFMSCTKESSLFILEKLDLHLKWNPNIINNTGEFSSKIKLHMSNKHQIQISNIQIEIVQLNEFGKFENVDLNGQVEFTLTTNF